MEHQAATTEPGGLREVVLTCSACRDKAVGFVVVGGAPGDGPAHSLLVYRAVRSSRTALARVEGWQESDEQAAILQECMDQARTVQHLPADHPERRAAADTLRQAMNPPRDRTRISRRHVASWNEAGYGPSGVELACPHTACSMRVRAGMANLSEAARRTLSEGRDQVALPADLAALAV